MRILFVFMIRHSKYLLNTPITFKLLNKKQDIRPVMPFATSSPPFRAKRSIDNPDAGDVDGLNQRYSQIQPARRRVRSFISYAGVELLADGTIVGRPWGQAAPCSGTT
jgi:hypothetical protein